MAYCVILQQTKNHIMASKQFHRHLEAKSPSLYWILIAYLVIRKGGNEWPLCIVGRAYNSALYTAELYQVLCKRLSGCGILGTGVEDRKHARSPPMLYHNIIPNFLIRGSSILSGIKRTRVLATELSSRPRT